jgi:hypothetical protein
LYAGERLKILLRDAHFGIKKVCRVPPEENVNFVDEE